jgi:diacylglycerol kinase (ATP)
MDVRPPIFRRARGTGSVERLFRAAINSWHGLIACAKSEAAFREELALLAVGVPLAFWITHDTGERFALIGVLFFLLIVELLNTAIEKLSDRVTREQDPLIKKVKDMGSAAIFLSLLAAGVTWILVLAERFWL